MEGKDTVERELLNKIAAAYFSGSATQKALAETYGYSKSSISSMCKMVKTEVMHMYVLTMKDAIYAGEDQQEANNRVVDKIARNYDMSEDIVIGMLTNEFNAYASMPDYGDFMLQKAALFVQILEMTPRKEL